MKKRRNVDTTENEIRAVKDINVNEKMGNENMFKLHLS